MIDMDRVRENLEEWLENPAWAEYYRDAPSGLCRQFIALHWYYSDCEDEEAGAEMDRIEQEELDIPDLRWLMKYSGNNPWKKRLQDRIRELEESGFEILE